MNFIPDIDTESNAVRTENELTIERKYTFFNGVYCNDCIDSWIATGLAQNGSAKCAICRKLIHEDSIIILKDVVPELAQEQVSVALPSSVEPRMSAS